MQRLEMRPTTVTKKEETARFTKSQINTTQLISGLVGLGGYCVSTYVHTTGVFMPEYTHTSVAWTGLGITLALWTALAVYMAVARKTHTITTQGPKEWQLVGKEMEFRHSEDFMHVDKTLYAWKDLKSVNYFTSDQGKKDYKGMTLRFDGKEAVVIMTQDKVKNHDSNFKQTKSGHVIAVEDFNLLQHAVDRTTDAKGIQVKRAWK